MKATTFLVLAGIFIFLIIGGFLSSIIALFSEGGAILIYLLVGIFVLFLFFRGKKK